MSLGDVAVNGVRVRWWVVGAMSSSPTGRRFALGAEELGEELARAASALQLRITDRLGAAEHRTLALSFARLRSFQLSEVMQAVPELRALHALAQSLDSMPPEAAVHNVEALVGAGRLSSAVGEALRRARASEPAPAPGPHNGASHGRAHSTTVGDSVDALFARTDTARVEDRAKAGVNAFLRSMGNRSAKPAGPPAEAVASARALVEQAVLDTAREVLESPEVARLESAWRGLKWLVEQCPARSGMVVEVLDVERAQRVAALEQALPADGSERPDACFVVEPVESVQELAALAALGERWQVPVVAAAPTSMFESGKELPEGWAELRAQQGSRWLCVATHRVVVAAEGKGTGQRASLASPVWALAGMLAASYRVTGGFARVTGREGALQAPAVWELAQGREAGVAVPTEVFVPIAEHARLAELGVVGLASGRNTDLVQVAAVPMAYRGEGAVPLPAQLLTGRIVRYAQWVRDQLPQGAGEGEVVELFSQAANLFLFGGAADSAGVVRSQVVALEGGGRVLHVSAQVRPEHAGLHLQLGFTLPLRG
jgi:type VI secretion system protein ImpC